MRKSGYVQPALKDARFILRIFQARKSSSMATADALKPPSPLTGKTISLDGFYFRDFRMDGQGNVSRRVINVNQSNHITLRRLLWDGRGAGYAGGLLMGADSKDLLVSNCVIIRGSDGMEVTACQAFA